MNLKGLVREISQRTNYTQKDILFVINNMIDIVEDTVASGEDVNIQGFGKFERHIRAPRNVRNPRTNEIINLGEMHSVKFKDGKDFKRKVRELYD